MAVTISRYDQMPLLVGNSGAASIRLDADTIKAELYNSSHTFAQANSQRSSISANALSTANGYTSPGASLASVTWAQASGTATFDAADVTWTASGGSIGPADYCVLYDDTSTNDLLMFSISFGASQTAGSGTNFVITWNASGIFTVA